MTKALHHLVVTAVTSITLFVSPAYSQEPTSDVVPIAPAQVPENLPEMVQAVATAAEFRPWIVAIHYSPFELILPNKIGASISNRESETVQWEFEYSHGSFTPFFVSEIGSFTEDRYSFLRRHGSTKGLHLFYGAFYQDFRLHIGSALMSRLSSGAVPSADLVSTGGFGATVGLGYRWLLKEKFVLGLDAAWSQPLVTVRKESKFLDVVTNRNDRDKVESGVKLMEYFPRFVVAKIVVGYNF